MRALRRLLWGLGVLALVVCAFWLWVVWPPWEATRPKANDLGAVSEARVYAESPPPLVAAPALVLPGSFTEASGLAALQRLMPAGATGDAAAPQRLRWRSGGSRGLGGLGVGGGGGGGE